MIKQFICCAAALSVALSTYADTAYITDVIPTPSEINASSDGVFVIPEGEITYHISPSESSLSDYLKTFSPRLKPVAGKRNATIRISFGQGNSDDYSMTVGKNCITIDGSGESGAFYGIQTLLQLLGMPSVTEIGTFTVKDTPRYAYRGLHFDVSRHFRSIDFLKKQIDAMALLKLNNMHLHLTDGAGWRIEIPGYPRLSEFAAWRPQREWQQWEDGGRLYCESSSPGAYGGYYTREELKELVDYATMRHVNIIPEIEMPGHSIEVTSAYPSLSCSGKPYTNDDLCVGKEETFRFLEDVFSEVIDIFPSAYIHLGGDEAGKAAWKSCPDCMRRMTDEGLTDVDQLQNYAVNRMARFLESKGRHAIGWDEVVHPDLDKSTVIMSWRGTEGGEIAMGNGHKAIMAPGKFCYLNSSQDAHFKEPVSTGVYLPLEMVYGYDPGSDSLLMGVQGCMWAEYVVTDEHAEYMYYPRTYAIAELGWAKADALGRWPHMQSRSKLLNKQMQAKGYTTFNLDNEFGERRETLTEARHSARGARVTYGIKPHRNYPAGGDGALTDGIRGGWSHTDGRWQGFLSDMDLTVDLGEIRPVHAVMLDCLHAPGAWIHLPQWVEVSLSADGENFTVADTVWSDLDPDYTKSMTRRFATSTSGAEARFVKIRAKRHTRPGAWIFTDEIIVE